MRVFLYFAQIRTISINNSNQLLYLSWAWHVAFMGDLRKRDHTEDVGYY